MIYPEGITGHAVFNETGTKRFSLSRLWASSPPVLWIMCNPSTATGDNDDPTLRRCIHFTAAHGGGGLTVVNVYPWIKTDPNVLKEMVRDGEKNRAPLLAQELNRNAERVVDMAKRFHRVVVAWGNNAYFNVAVDLLAERLKQEEVKLLCLGTTKSGAPKHPLARGTHRIPDNQKFIPWGKS